MAIACTIVARNYLPTARVLQASFAAVHPDVEFVVLLIDDETREVDAARERFRVVRLSDIGLPASEIAILAAIYDVTELATAVKPPLLSTLRREGHDVVLYLDPDIKVFAPLDEAFEGASRHAIVLTPHTMVPVPRDGRRIGTEHILAAGVYNLGFVAVGPGSDPFLEWWWKQTRREALSDPERMMFTDQRWIDLVPCLFDYTLLKHPGYNVAYWNLHGRRVVANERGYAVHDAGASRGHSVRGAVPLKFFHFSGFDHRKPHLLSKHQVGQPRILLSEHPAVAQLCADYTADLVRHGAAEATTYAYAWERCGEDLSLTPALRRLYWRAVLDAEEDDEAPPPSPFDSAGPDGFIGWLNEPQVPAVRPVISRYLRELYRRRPDLQTHFPDLAGKDGATFLEWVRTDGVKQESIPAALQPTPKDIDRCREPIFAGPDDVQPGVNLAGYFFAELGIGEAARLMSSALTAGGIRSETLLYDVTDSRQQHAYRLHGDGRAPFDVNLVCVNADMLPAFRSTFGSGLFEGRHTVGYWYWEVDDFPTQMWPAFDLVDEVWVASSFVAEAVRRSATRPVHCIPPPFVPPELPQNVARKDLGLPAGFLFLFVFDYLSVFDRKNPCDLVEAFTQAFAPGEGPRLVIKSINGDKRIADRERLLARVADRPDIILMEDYLSVAHKNALMGLCDCVVSLHRSEGLGLTMAEAMGLGKPVIATAYSGNLDFMTPENSYLVDYRLVPVPAGCDPYPPGTPWAQPDVEQAAALMRRVYLDQYEAASRGRRARADILTKHSPRERAKLIEQRLAAIRAARAAREAAQAPSPDEWHDLLYRAERHLPPGPAGAGGPRGFVQRVLLRLLRPYWYPQRVLQETLIDALRAADNRAGAQFRHLRHELILARERADKRLNQLNARLDRVEAGDRDARDDENGDGDALTSRPVKLTSPASARRTRSAGP